MILATAQTKPHRGDIAKNLQDHYFYINVAVNNGANLIVFPEMSITGYERENAYLMAFTPNDKRLKEFGRLSKANKIFIIAGAPVKMHSGLYIGEFIFLPDGSSRVYTKQFLHPGEEEFFKSSFDYDPIIKLGNEIISFAICADIDNPLHPEKASKNGCSTYMPSIFFSPNGIPDAYKFLSRYAEQYSMNVLMSNFVGESWGSPAGGKSAFWNKEGDLIASLDDINPGLLILENKGGQWIQKTVK